MKKRILAFLTALILATPGQACDPLGLTGIMEENDFWIPAGLGVTSEVSEEHFHRILDKIEGIYGPIVESKGKKLEIIRDWEDGTVNAYAMRRGSSWVIKMFGGLARHSTVTKDGFALVACHELGHHLGGAPKRSQFWLPIPGWASNEGQSDYFATTKCIRKYFEIDGDSASVVAEMDIPQYVTSKCQTQFSGEEEVATCQRAALAGLSLSKLFHSARPNQAPLNFETPDPKVVTRTYNSHPAPQCRLDTYFQGALCDKDHYLDVSQRDPNHNVCNRKEKDKWGLRPLCWYKPKKSGWTWPWALPQGE